MGMNGITGWIGDILVLPIEIGKTAVAGGKKELPTPRDHGVDGVADRPDQLQF